jgi:hypothetical protein
VGPNCHRWGHAERAMGKPGANSWKRSRTASGSTSGRESALERKPGEPTAADAWERTMASGREPPGAG